MCNEIKTEYERRIPQLQYVSNRLEQEVQLALRNVPRIDRVSFRVKGSGSLVGKATDPRNDPPYTDPLREIEDQVAGRVIVFSRLDLKQVEDLLVPATFSPVEAQERRPTADAEFGYESNHYICQLPPHLLPQDWPQDGNMPTTFELQVRTLFMHAWAEPQHDIGYKGGSELPKEVRRELAWIAASAWGADQAYERVFSWVNQKQ